MSFTCEMSLLQDGAVGARVIQASAHIRPACRGDGKLLPYAVTWHFIQVDGDLSPRGAGAGLCMLLY
jgi:hypothetical protein